MTILVYFHHNKDIIRGEDISTIGMNNLIIIKDKRITTKLGLVKRIESIVRQYHTAKLGRNFVCLKQDYKFCSGIIHETEGFSFR